MKENKSFLMWREKENDIPKETRQSPLNVTKRKTNMKVILCYKEKNQSFGHDRRPFYTSNA